MCDPYNYYLSLQADIICQLLKEITVLLVRLVDLG